MHWRRAGGVYPLTAWKDRNVVVIGLARSGVAVAKCLHQLGAKVVVNDQKPLADCPEAEELKKFDIPVICGHHPSDLITDTVDVVVKNPGIPYRIEPIQQALKKDIPVITEVEVAGQLAKAKIIGITGSNGKTTTTTLVGKMLEAGQLPVFVAGNIGTALSEVVMQLNDDQWLVAELSSFQLKGTNQFHPHIAACLNVYPAHLDYHPSLEDYWRSKANLFQNQTAADFSILNHDSEICRKMAERLRSNVLWFSRTQEVEQGTFIREGQIIAKGFDQLEQVIMPVEEIALPGEFNLENALAATAIALCCGCAPSAIRQVLSTFRGVEHRLEYVKELDGVVYYNDSKATNPQAATKAIQSFQQPLIWIAGGLDRGIDFAEMVPVIKDRVKTVIAYGESASILLKRAEEAGISDRFQVENVAEAVQVAKKQAVEGDIVLLSPACASWDQHTSFEERGSIFKQAVHKL